MLGHEKRVRFRVGAVYRNGGGDDDDQKPNAKDKDAVKEKAAPKTPKDDDEGKDQVFDVWTPFGDCGFDFQTGETYLVYADSDEDTSVVETDRCTRTRRLSDAGPDLAYLYFYKERKEASGRLEGFTHLRRAPRGQATRYGKDRLTRSRFYGGIEITGRDALRPFRWVREVFVRRDGSGRLSTFRLCSRIPGHCRTLVRPQAVPHGSSRLFQSGSADPENAVVKRPATNDDGLPHSKVKPIPDFAVNQARSDVVRPPERIACVQQVACVGDVDYAGGKSHVLADRLADGEVEGGVRRQVRRPVAV